MGGAGGVCECGSGGKFAGIGHPAELIPGWCWGGRGTGGDGKAVGVKELGIQPMASTIIGRTSSVTSSSSSHPMSVPLHHASLLHERQLDDPLKLRLLLPPAVLRLLQLTGRKLHGQPQLLVVAAGRLIGQCAVGAGHGAGLVLRGPG